MLLFPNIAKCNPAEVVETMKSFDPAANSTALGGSPAFVHRVALHAAKHNSTLPISLISVGGAPVYRGMLRTMVSVVTDKKAVVLYGSTEAEPISLIFAEEKLRLEAGKPDGLCVGRPVYEDSARVIGILSGESRECEHEWFGRV